MRGKYGVQYQVSFSLRQVSLAARHCFAHFCPIECEPDKNSMGGSWRRSEQGTFWFFECSFVEYEKACVECLGVDSCMLISLFCVWAKVEDAFFRGKMHMDDWMCRQQNRTRRIAQNINKTFGGRTRCSLPREVPVCLLLTLCQLFYHHVVECKYLVELNWQCYQ